MSYSNKILYFFHKNFYNYFNLYSKFLSNLSYDFIGNHSCGDIVFLQIIYHFFNNFIFILKHKIYGCGSAISSISLSSYYLFNKFYYQIFFLKNFYISNILNLPSIKFHCSLLSEDIILLNFYSYVNSYIIFNF